MDRHQITAFNTTLTVTKTQLSLTAIPLKINRLIGRAMHDYDMLTEGDRVLVAVSGGVDSLFLAWLLDYWQYKAPINYKTTAVHLDMGFDDDSAGAVQTQLEKLNIDFFVERTSLGKEALSVDNGKNGCYHCSKKRRNYFFDLARRKGFSKIAFGHHQEDIIETLFLNMFYSGNISTMVPRQDLFKGQLAIIRPLAYLDKKQINQLAGSMGIHPVPNPCPLTKKTKREHIRKLLASIYEQDNRIKANLFAALANIKKDYLLSHPTKKLHDTV